MGARNNLQIKYSDGNSVCVYSHWGGQDDLPAALRRALKRKERWDDEMYLGAIIMREVFRDDLDGSTGYGVQPYLGEEEYETTVVDMSKQEVDGVKFNEWINNQQQ